MAFRFGFDVFVVFVEGLLIGVVVLLVELLLLMIGLDVLVGDGLLLVVFVELLELELYGIELLTGSVEWIIG